MLAKTLGKSKPLRKLQRESKERVRKLMPRRDRKLLVSRRLMKNRRVSKLKKQRKINRVKKHLKTRKRILKEERKLLMLPRERKIKSQSRNPWHKVCIQNLSILAAMKAP